MRILDLSLGAGVGASYGIRAAFFRVRSASGELWLRGEGFEAPLTVGQSLTLKAPVTAFWVENRTGATVTADLIVADEGEEYDDSSIAGSVTATLTQALTVSNLGAVSVGTTAVLLCSADSARKGVRFAVTGQQVFIGGAGVTTATGIPVSVGSVWIEDDAAAAAWYGIAAAAGGNVVVQAVP